MVLMKSCCCFSNMKSACLAGGIYTIVIAGLGLFGTLFMGESGINRLETSWYIMLPGALLYIALLVGGILLIVGSRQGYQGRKHIMVFIIIMGIFLFICIGAMVAMIVLVAVADTVTPVIIIISAIIWVVQMIFMVLSFLSAISLYQQLREEGPNGPLSTPPVHVVTLVSPHGSYLPTAECPEETFQMNKKSAPVDMPQPPPYSPV